MRAWLHKHRNHWGNNTLSTQAALCSKTIPRSNQCVPSRPVHFDTEDASIAH
uniref:Uncharacterized protein n=1 Tax=Anguilla anguilla TaxID=7936 RepID=A0A0E9XH43_ANGAN